MSSMRNMTIATLLLAGMFSCAQDTMKREQLEIRSQLEQAIADIDHELDRVKREESATADSSKTKMEAKIEGLEEARENLSDHLDKVGDTTADEWDAFRREVDRSLENANEALKESKVVVG